MGRIRVTRRTVAQALVVAGAALLVAAFAIWFGLGAGLCAAGVVLVAIGLFVVDVDPGQREGVSRGNAVRRPRPS